MGNAVFPTLPGLKIEVSRTPTWNTTVKKAVAGNEFRFANQLYPIYEFELSVEFLRDFRSSVDELRTLEGFFNARAGSFDSFLWTDPDDNAVTLQSFGTGDGSTTAFQLVRNFGAAAAPVWALNGTPSIFRAGSLVTSGITIGPTGVVTFTTAPTAGQSLTWTGSYYKRVRFRRDALELEKFMRELWEAKRIEFVETNR
jgi:uncharacterized protein (TIGR02217 family)